jgi:GAF domain-containing protein
VIDDTALRGAVRDYARRIASAYELGDALYSVTDLSLQVLYCDGAGISVGDTDGTLRFVTATEQGVVRIEEEQAIAQEGPCFEAYETGKLVVTSDLAEESRWERYRETALDAGFRAVAGVPMLVEDVRIGAMNLYHTQPHEWSQEELEVAQVLADMASGYIANHRTLAESRRLADQLQKALDSRVVIEQAKGVLAASHHLHIDDAFQHLRARARSAGRKLHDVAREVVEHRPGPSTDLSADDPQASEGRRP